MWTQYNFLLGFELFNEKNIINKNQMLIDKCFIKKKAFKAIKIYLK